MVGSVEEGEDRKGLKSEWGGMKRARDVGYGVALGRQTVIRDV